MAENYIQYASGYQKDNIDERDILKTISDIQLMDDEHGAFWVSVITNDENVIEVNKFHNKMNEQLIEGNVIYLWRLDRLGRRLKNVIDLVLSLNFFYRISTE